MISSMQLKTGVLPLLLLLLLGGAEARIVPLNSVFRGFRIFEPREITEVARISYGLLFW